MAAAAFLSAGLEPAFMAPTAQFRGFASRGAAVHLRAPDAAAAPERFISTSAGFASLAAAAAGAAALASAAWSGRQQGGSASYAGSGATVLRAFEDELGVQPPTGFWDPAGFTSDGDQFDFYRRRCVEIKHGRVSMLACIGYIAPEYFRWPGYLSPSIGLKFTDVPNGLAALTKVPAIGWQQIIFFGLAMELFAAYQNPKLPPGKLSSRLVVGLTTIEDWPNNYEFGPFGIVNAPPIADPEVRKKKLNAEIANGRLAMVAILGMLFQNGTVGTTGPEMWLPPNAFEEELGVQSPTGFWDPAGFCADGDQAAFRRRRVTELKHGRVSMLAAIGYMVPEGYRFPGYLSPSEDLKFADMPHGLAAISKVPLVGILQFVFFIGFIERVYYKDDPSRIPGDYANAGVLGFPDGSTISDPEEKARRLNSEIANGRLAMTAILALFFQNGTVGTTGPDMWIPPSFVKPAMMNFQLS